jgi:lysozyme
VRVQGCDVSHWEGIIDWRVAARWVPFAYFKCTDGQSMFDNTYQINKAGCQAAGIPFAPYHYWQPTHDPEEQAIYFVTKVGDHAGRYIVDVEESSSLFRDLGGRLFPCLKKIEQLTGKKPAIYTSAGFWNEHMNPKPAWAHEYELLVAHYTIEHTPILPIGWDRWIIWQYTDSFYFPGCQSAADGDWFNGSLDQCRQWFGNYRQEDPPSVVPFQFKSLFDNLHIRQQPSTTAKGVGHLARDEIVELVDVAGVDVWIRHARGYSAVEIGGYRYMEVVK